MFSPTCLMHQVIYVVKDIYRGLPYYYDINNKELSLKREMILKEDPPSKWCK